jgi:hypothetical protein
MSIASPAFPAEEESGAAFLALALASQPDVQGAAPRRYVFRCGEVYADVELSLKLEEERMIYEKIHRASVAEIDKSLVVTKRLKSDNSTSPTVQYLAEVLGSNVFMKVSFEEQGNVHNRHAGLRAEQRIYAEVVNQLLFSRSTPHLVAYYGLAKLYERGGAAPRAASSDERRGRSRERAQRSRSRSGSRTRSGSGTKLPEETRQYLTDRGFNPDKPIALILESEEHGVTLNNLEREYGREALRTMATATRDPFIDALLQVLWTLECFHQVGLQHGDLHWGNIFVRVYEQPVTFVYRLTAERSVVLNTCIDVQIYDYDASQKFATDVSPCEIRNVRLNALDCPMLGVECDYAETARDIVRFVYYYTKQKPINSYARMLIDMYVYDLAYIETLDRRHGAVWDGYPCRGVWGKVCDEPIEYDVFFRAGRSPLDQFMMLASLFGLAKDELIPAEDLCLLTRTFILPERTGELVQSCAPAVSVEEVRSMEKN